MNESVRRQYIAGVDEAGRGPLAGPVVAAAVILDDERSIKGLADSKTLSPSRREELSVLIKERAVCWALGRADVGEIDKLNILRASLLAMQRAVEALKVPPQLALIDGNQLPLLSCQGKAVIRGDVTVPVISAASILAKVARDAEMCELDKLYPEYGFSQHKGYPTEHHLRLLEQYGASPIHRRSFGPVRQLLNRPRENT